MMNKVEEAISILSGLLGDLCALIEVLKDYEHQPEFHKRPVFRQSVYRLCLQSIILNMAKYEEFTTKYSKVVLANAPQHHRVMNNFKEQIKKKGVITFRNDYVAHVQRSKEKRVLTDEEVDEQIHQIVGDNAIPFFDWICPEDTEKVEPNGYLVGVIQLIRDDLSRSL
jgi:hypothetical protein